MRAANTQAHGLALTGMSLFIMGSITAGDDAFCQRAVTARVTGRDL